MPITEPPEITLIEIPVILATVIGAKEEDGQSRTLFDCFSDWLALGKSYRAGEIVRITFIPQDHYQRRTAGSRQSDSSGPGLELRQA